MALCKGFSQQHELCAGIQVWKDITAHVNDNGVSPSYEFGGVGLSLNNIHTTYVSSSTAEGLLCCLLSKHIHCIWKLYSIYLFICEFLNDKVVGRKHTRKRSKAPEFRCISNS